MSAYWTDTFEQLHHAATTGAPAQEIERLEQAELDELFTEDQPTAAVAPVRDRVRGQR